jgi:galactose mutarotase-like enzyme
LIDISAPSPEIKNRAMATKPFGAHPVTGEPLTLTTVTSKPTGLIEVSFTNVGASIVSWKIGRIAQKKELVLGFDDGTAYLAPPSENPFFGTWASVLAD